jgi:hypothetical protein
MHYEIHDSSGTQLLLLHGGLFDIHQQFDELLPGKLTEQPIDPPTTLGGRLKLAHPQVLTISPPAGESNSRPDRQARGAVGKGGTRMMVK